MVEARSIGAVLRLTIDDRRGAIVGLELGMWSSDWSSEFAGEVSSLSLSLSLSSEML